MASRELLFFDRSDFEQYRHQQEMRGYRIVTISEWIRGIANADEVDPKSNIVDISALASFGIDLQYNGELFISRFQEDIVFIADRSKRELFVFELRYCFDSFDDVVLQRAADRPGAQIEDKTSLQAEHIRVVDLTDDQLDSFLSKFSKELYGHDKFKDEFGGLITNFRIFNKLGEHKILSLFLMGESGVGKTEVARAIHRSLGGKSKLAKINFGNYSSDNSLNSLIGSPRGYIGSEEGEIFMRVKQSDTGLILIDEFEKSNSTLFNYFLDVLENGKMVSSMAEEIDLDGFIIVFTSNISMDDFKSVISPELRSRFDYKGLFTALYTEDKMKFVDFRVASIIAKYNSKFDTKLAESVKDEIVGTINVVKFDNMRDLNKAIKDRFVEYVTSLNLVFESYEVLAD